jgi:phage terminase large subunit-like protein
VILVGPPQQREPGAPARSRTTPEGLDAGRGVPDALDSVIVQVGRRRRRPGQGVGVLAFKSYEKGRQKWQGETLHGVWYDEEPPLDIYSEGKTRTQRHERHQHRDLHAAARHVDVVQLFLTDEAELGKAARGRMSRHVTFMTIDDAEHYTPGAARRDHRRLSGP